MQIVVLDRCPDARCPELVRERDDQGDQPRQAPTCGLRGHRGHPVLRVSPCPDGSIIHKADDDLDDPLRASIRDAQRHQFISVRFHGSLQTSVAAQDPGPGLEIVVARPVQARPPQRGPAIRGQDQGSRRVDGEREEGAAYAPPSEPVQQRTFVR